MGVPYNQVCERTHDTTEFSSDPTFRVWIHAAARKESGAWIHALSLPS